MNEELWMELDKIDELRERMGVSYEEARQALAATGGDVIQALINLENKSKSMDWKDKGQDMLTSMRSSMANLNHTRVNVRKDNKKVLSVSAPLGLALGYTIWRNRALRLLGLAGVAGALFSNIDFDIEQAKENKSNNNNTNYAKPNYSKSNYADMDPEGFVYPEYTAENMSGKIEIPPEAENVKAVPDA